MNKITHADAPTKVILSGEHAVVYGFPALVMALDLKVGATTELTDRETIVVTSPELGTYEIDMKSSTRRGDQPLMAATEVAAHVKKRIGGGGGLNIRTWGNAPIAAGIGSSASSFVSVASSCFNALGHEPTKQEVFEAAMVGERIVHENPSGVDVEIAISGGVIRYAKSKGSSKSPIGAQIPLLVVNTGDPRRTGDMVAKFRMALENGGETAQLWLNHIGLLTAQIEKALETENLQLAGALMTSNHLALSFFGMSTPHLDKIVFEANKLGAPGAKLTGAGGGGSAIILVTEEVSDKINRRMNEIGYQSFKAKLSSIGVRSWQE